MHRCQICIKGTAYLDGLETLQNSVSERRLTAERVYKGMAPAREPSRLHLLWRRLLASGDLLLLMLLCWCRPLLLRPPQGQQNAGQGLQQVGLPQAQLPGEHLAQRQALQHPVRVPRHQLR